MRIVLICLLLLTGCWPAEARVGKLRSAASARTFTQRLGENIRRQVARFQPLKCPPSAAYRYINTGCALQDPSKLLRQENILTSLAFPLDSDGNFLGSGFVMRSASGKLYAVTSYHVAGSAGKPVGVHLFLPDGKGIVYDKLKVSSGGIFGVNAPDVSLIELPKEVNNFVRPLELAPAPPREGERVFMWGLPYDAAELALVKELRVEDSFGMKTVLAPEANPGPLEGMCGSPVFNGDGLVTGIYSGRGRNEGDMFAVDARKSLTWLLQKYEGRVAAPYVFQFMGRTALSLAAGESVGRIRHVMTDGNLLREIDFPVYRDRLDVSRLEELFPDARSGETIEFEIIKNRIVLRWVLFKIP